MEELFEKLSQLYTDLSTALNRIESVRLNINEETRQLHQMQKVVANVFHELEKVRAELIGRFK